MKYLIYISFIFFITNANTALNADFQYYKENNIIEEYKLKLHAIWDKVHNRNEETMGELFSFFILETILLGQLMKVNPFDQPSVELIKKETVKILR